MTKEEKAKAYDEALERAKGIKSKLLSSHLSTESCKAVSEYIDEIIPGLRESEDERIRKEIVFIVKQYGRICEKEGDPCCTINDCLAYLERLKERKPKNILTNDDSLRTAYLKGQTDVLEDPEAFGLQKEQKPVEWSEEDEMYLSQAIETLEHENYSILADKLKSLHPVKQEWSNDDEKMRDKIIDVLNRTYTVYSALGTSSTRPSVPTYADEIAWLKSLRPSWKPSEEQMEALLMAIEGKCPSPTSYLSRRLEELYDGLANTYGVEAKEDKK